MMFRRLLVAPLRAFLSLVAEHKRRRVIRELERLDGRTLADMRLTRGEIEAAVRSTWPHEAWAGEFLAELPALMARPATARLESAERRSPLRTSNGKGRTPPKLP